MENEYEICTGIELDGKFYELTQKQETHLNKKK